MKTPIMQFGTSRFLQAHADLFVSEAMEKGEALGPITVVQTTGASERAERLKGLAVESGFPVHIRGIEEGRPVDRLQQVTSVRRALSASADWAEVERVFVEEVQLVICNTADRGYDISLEPATLPADMPVSFPGKLTVLLHRRFGSGRAGLTILPCELISRNGEALRAIVTGLASRWYADDTFNAWLATEVIFCNTLVDRIVSESLSPAGAVAEPYALWAIQRMPGQALPCVHPDIVVADDIEPYEKLKLFILNLGHTYLASRWIEQGRTEAMTVREMLGDPETRGALLSLYETEVVPGFARKEMEVEAEAYVVATLQRFDNPFLDHKLSDIAQNHVEKIRRRFEGFVEWSGIPAPTLQAIIRSNAEA
ncbi:MULTISPECIES: mannitol dehydrogenase family protein [Rhizobium]|uniref:Mannitol dehydrogenase family protein n=1 Tax=Rhizobium rhododendri TaxID=2506430 RepID=A0ABY8IHL1_9HYPH|nr:MULTISPECIES: mannitol dehydrogenase family protein [Rhizobium]MBZ5759734.1 mannitol dehydrogenase family protein [Rhizobium sp. VS19-DR96]MBZ5766122.1 mannitol dehydrogenase family protein [Rhizobium sp. VS19-DR129.2]MBZ5772905.1 mannitol dehydrogenase family protein [Rhizobium sp. VS19-DRK62.2]MBZ5783889.1 mannitol dehydrogenase family protein [Rhizobium sp. VS19-DR121]MBZ5803466.1 mannitol dehydrogenase family protein [Rhizobium sp. VS19-DR181]